MQLSTNKRGRNNVLTAPRRTESLRPPRPKEAAVGKLLSAAEDSPNIREIPTGKAYKETRNFLMPVFGPHAIEIILLTELMSLFVLAIKMRITGKFLYRLLNSFSIKTIFVALFSTVLLFGMIDKVFVFFILALIFIIVDLFAVEAEEFYYKGNFIIIVFLFAAAVFGYTGSAAIMLLFLVQYGFNSIRKTAEPYDWLLLSLYFAVPITFYSAGTLSPIAFWIGFYFLFKSFTILAEIFGIRIFDLGERARKMLSLKSGKEKYF